MFNLRENYEICAIVFLISINSIFCSDDMKSSVSDPRMSLNLSIGNCGELSKNSLQVAPVRFQQYNAANNY